MLQTPDGFSLFTQNNLVENAKAHVLIVHGLGEHCLRYQHVAKALNAKGFNVFAFDLRGHGQSSGERGLITNISEYLEDVKCVKANVPNHLPFFMIGHSMGGLITLQYLLDQSPFPLKGVVLTSAALEVGADITPFKQFVIKLLAFISPKFKTVKLDPTSISRDSNTVQNYINDPLIYHDAGKAGLGVALLSAIKNIKLRFSNLAYPVLLMHGTADTLTNPEGTKALYAQSVSQDKTLKLWEGAYHELFNETNQTEVIDYMTAWINERVV